MSAERASGRAILPREVAALSLIFMKLLAFAASVREQSLNRKLIELACRIARSEGAEVDLVSFRDFDMPMYDGDQDAREGLPPGGLRLKQKLDVAEAVMIAAPEYNYSIPGPLKNAIDWTSRARPMPWRAKSMYLLSASPSPIGGIRGLWQTRIPLEGCGAVVFPDMFALAFADKAFDEKGGLKDPALAERLECEIRGFVRMAEVIAPAIGPAYDPNFRARQKQIEAALEDESQIQPAPH